MNDVSRDDMEDIEACARAGRRPRDSGPYRIQVGDAFSRFQAVVADHAAHTGRSLLELADLHPVEDHVLFAVLVDGLLEEIRLDESIDLRDRVEKFLAFKSDRIFRLLVDDREYHWGGVFINGATVLKLSKADPDTHGVWLLHPDDGERQVRAAELIDLGQPGVETFVTRPLAAA